MSRFICIAISIAFLCASPARAATLLTFEFTGVVTVLDYNAGFFGAPGTASIGDTFSGSFSYIIGPSNPDQAPADSETGAYEITSFTLIGTSLSLDPEFVVVSHIAPLPTLPPAPPDTGEDRFAMALSPPVGPYAAGVRFTLSGDFGDAFTDDSLPLGLDLADFMIAAITASGPISLIIGVPTLVDRGEITALTLVSATEIPLPPAAWLFVAGLGFAARARRRHDDAT